MEPSASVLTTPQKIYSLWKEREDQIQKISPAGRTIRIIGFDPGGTIGWSVMEITFDALNDQNLSRTEKVTGWWHGQLRSDDEDVEMPEPVSIEVCTAIIENSLALADDIAVVSEDYQIRSARTDKQTISPIRLLAGLEQNVWSMGRRIQKQMPSEKSGATDERLKNWGFYSPGSQHARDADRHALIFMAKLAAKKSLQRKFFPNLDI